MPQQSSTKIPIQRARFRQIVAVNPNYFGNQPNSSFEPVEEKTGDTHYEEIGCVSYSPERDRLEATFDIKRPFGYSGPLCSEGSYEYVRFYVSYNDGGTWEDAGYSAASVHDLPKGEDCEGKPTFPVSYVVGAEYDPKRRRCAKPVLPLVRAILSWNVVPPQNQPDWVPVWGNVKECHVRVVPRKFVITDILTGITSDVKAQIPSSALNISTNEPVDPEDPKAAEEYLGSYDLKRLREEAREQEIPEERFAMPIAHKLAQVMKYQQEVAGFGSPQLKEYLEIQWPKLWEEWAKPKSNTSYEELHCVGLDNNADQLVGTFTIKRPSGYGGNQCGRGQYEYVAFWADFGTDCKYTYMGTVKVNVHDFKEFPDGGLCYAAVLPVDLFEFRKTCEEPVIGRVRAVLSYATPPSTTDPDDVPYWGNRVDSHVQLRPVGSHGETYLTHVGGVNIDEVGPTGVTLPGAHLVAGLSYPLPTDKCPFRGRIAVRGVLNPALAGQQYRLLARNISQGGAPDPMTDSFKVAPAIGPSPTVTPDPNGWLPWPTFLSNTTGLLGAFNSGALIDDLVEIQLEIQGQGVVETTVVQTDNLLRGEVVAGDTENAASLTLFTGAQCKAPKGPLKGRFVARDKHFYSWGLSLAGGPSSPTPQPSLSGLPAGFTVFDETTLAGQDFEMDLSTFASCGYTVVLTVRDRSIVNSHHFGPYRIVDKGLCLE